MTRVRPRTVDPPTSGLPSPLTLLICGPPSLSLFQNILVLPCGFTSQKLTAAAVRHRRAQAEPAAAVPQLCPAASGPFLLETVALRGTSWPRCRARLTAERPLLSPGGRCRGAQGGCAILSWSLPFPREAVGVLYLVAKPQPGISVPVSPASPQLRATPRRGTG